MPAMILLPVFLMIFGPVSAQPGWSYDPADYTFTGEVNAVVIFNSAEVTGGILGVFVGEECRGFTEGLYFVPTGKVYFSLICNSNSTSGEELTFRYYNEDDGLVYAIEETQVFTSNMVIGAADDPWVLHALGNAAPVADCPVLPAVLPSADPITFNLCGIFADPDGDELTFDAVKGDGTTTEWNLPCELTFIPAASGESTLTLSASDGNLSAQCQYTIIVNTNNQPPEIVSPLGMIRLDQGFTTFQVDLDTVFTDPNGDDLSYTVNTPGNGIVSAGISGSILTLSEGEAGNTVITITASDGEYNAEEKDTVVVFADISSYPWNVSPANFLFTGEVNATVSANGSEVTSGSLAAFVGEECRGVVEGEYFEPGGITIFSMIVYSHSSSGDILTFRYHDQHGTDIFQVDEVIPFKADMKLGDAFDPETLHFSSTNQAPTIDRPVPDQDQDEHFYMMLIDLDTVFSDPDADVLQFYAQSEKTSVATVSLSGSVLTITEAGNGNTRISITASDGHLSIDNRFVLTINPVNDPPVVQNPIPDQSLLEGFGTKKINISNTFRDPDGDVLNYTASSGNLDVVTVKITGASLEISEMGPGSATVSVCVADNDFTVCDEFTVEVGDINLAPEAECESAENLVLVEGFGTVIIEDLCKLFTDPDGDPLNFTATSNNTGVLDVTMNACDLQVSDAGIGTATIEVCADDGEFDVCCFLEIEIVEENLMEIYLMEDQLVESDSVKACSDATTLTLVVYSDLPWSISSTGSWLTATKTNVYNAEIVFSENTTGAARSGTISISDTQNHVIGLTAYQSGNCNPDAVRTVHAGNFTIYPNPVKERLFIEMNRGSMAEPLRIILSDISGRKQLEIAPGTVLLNDAIELDMQAYKAGIYIISVEYANGRCEKHLLTRF